MNYRIILDSCGELTDKMKESGCYASVPLTLYVDDYPIIDDETFEQKDFLNRVAKSVNCPRSSCPSPEAYKYACECEAERIYIVTLSSNLSGSYNSAELGKSLYEEEKSDKKIYVFDSKGASVKQTLIGMKIAELEEAGKTFKEVVEETEKYIYEQNEYFVLENLDTLRKNGRLSLVKALVAGALKIKPVMIGNKEGNIEQIDQARGINKAILKMVDYIVDEAVDSENKILGISHCNCPERAEMVKDELMRRRKGKDIFIVDTAGVSSLYANDGGIIITV